MALQLETICTSIAAISVTGLTIKDIDEIPETLDLAGPTLYPNPEAFITDFVATYDSFGTGTAKKTVTYRLNYRLSFSPVGGTLATFEAYSRMLSLAIDVMDAIMAQASIGGAVLADNPTIGQSGVLTDNSNNSRWSCDLSLKITEFVN